jgi:hypothetical protein
MFKNVKSWCLFPMFMAYLVAFGIAAAIMGPKVLILPAVEVFVLGTLVLAFNSVEKKSHGRKCSSTS